MDAHERIEVSDREFPVPQGKILQLPPAEAMQWMQRMADTSQAVKLLRKEFEGQGYRFYFERSKVFVTAARDPNGDTVPSVLGILPSFVPVTSVDAGHSAASISVHHSGYALATSVHVDHRPFGVTEFTLHEIDPSTRAIKTSTVSADDVVNTPVSQLASRLHAPFVPRGESERGGQGTRGLGEFSAIGPGEQGLLIGTVVQQLLAEDYSRALFPPEYARAIRMQTPTFQKFALATRERFVGTVLGLTLCTSSSSSSNICTSTSTSTIEL
jgi:hypothetical protein